MYLTIISHSAFLYVQHPTLAPSGLRIEYMMAALVWSWLLGLAPVYLVKLCGPTLSARSSCSLRLTEQCLLHVPFTHTSTRQKRSFSVVGLSIWSGLPLSLRSLPRILSH